MNAPLPSMPDLMAPTRSAHDVGVESAKPSHCEKSSSKDFSATMDRCLADQKSPPREAEKSRAMQSKPPKNRMIGEEKSNAAAQAPPSDPCHEEVPAATDASLAATVVVHADVRETPQPLSVDPAQPAGHGQAPPLAARLVNAKTDVGLQIAEGSKNLEKAQNLHQAMGNTSGTTEEEVPAQNLVDGIKSRTTEGQLSKLLGMLAAKRQSVGREEMPAELRSLMPNLADGPRFAGDPTLVQGSLAVSTAAAGDFEGLQQDSSSQNRPQHHSPTAVAADISVDPSSENGSEFKTRLAVPRHVQQQILEQIVAKATLYRTSGQTEMRINIKPEFWGPLQMNISADSQQLTIRIMTELPLVKEMIEHHLQQLRASLQDQGLEVASFEVSIMDDAHYDRGHQAGARFQKSHGQVEVSDTEDVTVDGSAISAQRVMVSQSREGRIDLFT